MEDKPVEEKPRRFFSWNIDGLNRKVKLGEIIVIIISFLFILTLLEPFTHDHSRFLAKARQTTCVSNIHQLSMASLMYAEDHGEIPGIVDEKGEEYLGWVKKLTPYIKGGSDVTRVAELFFCPEVKSELTAELTTPPISYGYNSVLLQSNGKGIKSKKIIRPELTGILCDAELLKGCESQGGLIGDADTRFNVKNKNISLLFVKPASRHKLKNQPYSIVIGYADGHAKAVEVSNISDKENEVNKAFYRAVELGYIKKTTGGR